MYRQILSGISFSGFSEFSLSVLHNVQYMYSTLFLCGIMSIFLFRDITLGEAKELIKSLDPHKPMNDIQQFILKMFSIDDDQAVITAERLLKCLEKTDMSLSEQLN